MSRIQPGPNTGRFARAARRATFVLALAGMPIVLAHAMGVRVNWTESMPLGLYLETEPRLERGAWAVVCLEGAVARLGRERGYLPRGDCPSGVMPIVKEIVAVPGDRVRLDRLGLEINGRRLPETALVARDTQGRVLTHARFGERRLGPEEFWVLGDVRSRSWDSRYFGFVSEPQIVGSATPLLTWSSSGPRNEARKTTSSRFGTGPLMIFDEVLTGA